MGTLPLCAACGVADKWGIGCLSSVYQVYITPSTVPKFRNPNLTVPNAANGGPLPLPRYPASVWQFSLHSARGTPLGPAPFTAAVYLGLHTDLQSEKLPETGATPLCQVAAHEGTSEVVRVLIEAGANDNSRDATPLF